MLFLLILIFILFRKHYEYFEPLKSQPATVIKYRLINKFKLTNLEKNPLIIDLHGPLLNISLEKLFPCRKKKSNLGSINTLINIINRTSDIGYISENVITNYDTINKDKFKKIYDKYNKVPLQKLNIKNIRQICSLFDSQFTLITHDGNDIKKYQDIYNTKIGILGNDSMFSLFSIYNYFEWEWNDKIIYYTQEFDIVNDFKKRNIESIFMVIVHPSSLVEYITKNLSVRLISTNDINIDKLRYFLPSIKHNHIPIQYYFNDKYIELESLSLKTILITNKFNNKKSIYEFTKFIYQNLGYFKNYNVIFHYIFEPDLFFKYLELPYHVGSKEYYIHQGYISYKKPCTKNNTFIDCKTKQSIMNKWYNLSNHTKDHN